MTKTVVEWCAAGMECDGTPDRTVIWAKGDELHDFTHECAAHAAESAVNPFAYDDRGTYRFAGVFSGIRHLDIRPDWVFSADE